MSRSFKWSNESNVILIGSILQPGARPPRSPGVPTSRPGQPIRNEGFDRQGLEGHAVFVGPRRRDQPPAEGQLRLVAVRESETRPVPPGLPERRVPDGQPGGRGVLDHDPEDDQHERPAADGRHGFESRQLQPASVISKNRKTDN